MAKLDEPNRRLNDEAERKNDTLQTSLETPKHIEVDKIFPRLSAPKVYGRWAPQLRASSQDIVIGKARTGLLTRCEILHTSHPGRKFHSQMPTPTTSPIRDAAANQPLSNRLSDSDVKPAQPECRRSKLVTIRLEHNNSKTRSVEDSQAPWPLPADFLKRLDPSKLNKLLTNDKDISSSLFELVRKDRRSFIRHNSLLGLVR